MSGNATSKPQDYTGGIIMKDDDNPNGGYRYRVVVGWDDCNPILEDSSELYKQPEDCRTALFERVKELRYRDDDILAWSRLMKFDTMK